MVVVDHQFGFELSVEVCCRETDVLCWYQYHGPILLLERDRNVSNRIKTI